MTNLHLLYYVQMTDCTKLLSKPSCLYKFTCITMGLKQTSTTDIHIKTSILHFTCQAIVLLLLTDTRTF